MYREKTRLEAPCEFWLLTLQDEDFDVRLDPVFVAENKVLFGRFRRLGLSNMLRNLLGHEFLVSAERSGDGIAVVVRKKADRT